MNRSLYLDRAALRFNLAPYLADLAHLTEITLQDVPDREYALRLLVENEEIELQKTANRSWTPVNRQYALPFLIVHRLRVMLVQGCLIDIRDTREDRKEDRPFLLGEESTE